MELQVIVTDFLGILSVVPRTLAMAVTIFILSTILGTIITLIEQYKIPVLRQIVVLFKLFLKGTPMVIYIFIVYFALPPIIGFFVSLVGIHYNPDTLSPVFIIIFALTLSVAPFQSEIIRGAFFSVNYGQIEAAYSLGYSFFQAFRRVIVPQALLEAIPDLANSFMVIIKALSLAFLLTVVDIFAKATLIASLDYHYLEAFFTAALFYWLISYLLTMLADKSEQRFRGRA